MKDKPKKWVSLLITLLVWILAGYQFYDYIRTARESGAGPDLTVGLVSFTVMQAVVVHLIKSFRLYLILFENRTNFSSFILMYAETSLINLLLPYKCGELYRGYRVGRSVCSFIQGYATVLFDRFIDTLALITTILLMAFYYSAPLMPVFIVFFAFCVLLILIYCLFPPLNKYLNHFLIFNRSSENTLVALHILQLCDKAYKNVNKMARGRFLFLYLLSVMAWFVEVGGLTGAVNAAGGTGIGEYLQAAILGSPTQENVAYFYVCFALFGLVSVFMRIGIWRGGKDDGRTRGV